MARLDLLLGRGATGGDKLGNEGLELGFLALGDGTLLISPLDRHSPLESLSIPLTSFPMSSFDKLSVSPLPFLFDLLSR